MHDLGVHHFWIASGIFIATFIAYLMADWLEYEQVNHGRIFSFFVLIVSCLSKVCNIGLGIAVGIEFFMLAHGG